MKEHYFHQKNFIPLAQTFEKPIHDILELNVKTLQSLSYVTPLEFFNVTKPEQILEKNVNVLVQNSHQALNYIYNVFNIMEKHWLNLSEKVTETSNEIISTNNLSDAVIQNLLKSTTSSAKKSAKKVVKSVKSVVSKSVPKSAVSKSIPKSAVSKSVPKSAVSKSVPKSAVSKSVPKSSVGRSVSKSSVQPAKQEQLQQQVITKTQPASSVSNPFNLKLAQQSISESHKSQSSSVAAKPEAKNPDTKLIK